MSDEKTFEVGGTSIKNGTKTWRFANGKPEARAKVLNGDNHSEVNLVALPSPMTRDAAIAWLRAQGFDAAEPTRAVGGGGTPKAPREPKAPKEPKGMTMTRQDRAERPSVLTALEAEGTPELEAAAKACHKADWLGFKPWAELPVEVKAEYRLQAQKAMDAAAAPASEEAAA